MNTIEPTLIKKKELAKRLSVSTRSIDTWVGKRMIPYIRKRPIIVPLVAAARSARLGPCLLQNHPGLGDVTDGPPRRGSWKWRCRHLLQAPWSSSWKAAGAFCSVRLPMSPCCCN